MTFFDYGSTVTIRRSGGTDPFGDPLPGTEHQLHGVAVAPRTSNEDHTRGNAVVVGYELYAAYDADLRATDQVLLPGDPDPWEVEGEPGRWRDPFTNWAPGLHVALRRVGSNGAG